MQTVISNLTYNVGIYCRLSRDDGNDSISMSIENQRDSLKEYVERNNWNLIDIYVDDGFTGTNFNRPSFNRLINDIEAKRINCVITKDLSRLGRNYLQTGYYTEEYFPTHDVRYIAVNDNFDTKKDNEFAPFKNIINEWYAKDISKKVRFSLNQKMSKPNVLGCSVPLYGYYHQEGKRIINPETAPNVRRMVTEYIAGKSTKEIAKGLTEDKIMCPSYYNYLKYNTNSERFSNCEDDLKYKWHREVVRRILASVEYTGVLINHKTEVLSFKNKKKLYLSEEKQYRFDDVFEPIITKDEHKIILKMLSQYKHEPIGEDENIFRGVLLCGCCGKTLKYQRKVGTNRKTRYLYQCRNKECTNKANVKIGLVKELVESEYSLFIDAIVSNEEDFIEFAKNYTGNKNNTIHTEENNEELIKKLSKESSTLDMKISALFEANLNDEIPSSTYEKMMKQYKLKKEELETTIRSLSSKVKPKDEKVDYVFEAKQILEYLKEYNASKMLNHNLIVRTIQSISFRKINKEYKIHIIYSNSNLIKEYMKCKQPSPQYM